MIHLLGAQLLAIAAAMLLLGLPGWALSRILELHLRVPTVALPVVYFTLGLAVWTVAVVPSLSLGWPIAQTLGVHAALTIVLIVVARVRERRRGHAKQGSD